MKFTTTLFLFLSTTFLFAQNPVHNNNGFVDNQIHVKFPDDYPVIFKERSADISEFAGDEIITELELLGCWQKVYPLSNDELTRLRRTAERNLGKKLPDPNSKFYFRLYNPSNYDRAMELLKSCNGLYISKVPVLFNAAAPSYLANQYYVSSTIAGVDADTFYTTYNNRGIGVKVCDIEYGFNENHTDFPNIVTLGNTPQDPFGGTSVNHGTAVFGEIGSLNDSIGTTGLASDCEMYFAGAYTDSTYSLEAAIANALTVLEAGDVILIEQQIGGPNVTGEGQFGLVAVEWYKPFYDAIVLAIGQDVIVVEAAGNGEQDLDGPMYNIQNDGHWPFIDGNGSGAIIVGAGSPGPQAGGSDVARSKMWFSNYGSCVNVQGLGERVYTTGYGNLYSVDGEDSWYTSSFSGTSSASPIVTGSVVLLQSIYKSITGNHLTPQAMKDLLMNTGKPQQDGDFGAGNNIGPLPDVIAAAAELFQLASNPNIPIETPVVFPNPNNGNFSVKLNGEFGKIYSVTDMTGRQIQFNANYQPGTFTTVSIPGATPGIYLVKFENSVARILIQ